MLFSNQFRLIQKSNKNVTSVVYRLKALIMVIAHFLSVDPPKIARSLKTNISLRAGDRLELNCRATGLPTPQVTWIRSGRGFNNHTLVVNRVNKKDSGLYLCKANSPAGEDSMKIFVRVKDGDKPPTQAIGEENL